jgi:hypothetical protein
MESPSNQPHKTMDASAIKAHEEKYQSKAFVGLAFIDALEAEQQRQERPPPPGAHTDPNKKDGVKEEEKIK